MEESEKKEIGYKCIELMENLGCNGNDIEYILINSYLIHLYINKFSPEQVKDRLMHYLVHYSKNFENLEQTKKGH